jgi:large subunit ribosomal protein L23
MSQAGGNGNKVDKSLLPLTQNWSTDRLWAIELTNKINMIPLFTEKSARILENNQYTFDVDPSLSKTEIRDLVEKTFQVKVISLNTHRPPRKNRRLGQYLGTRPQVKRVIFTLRKEDSIPLFE